MKGVLALSGYWLRDRGLFLLVLILTGLESEVVENLEPETLPFYSGAELLNTSAKFIFSSRKEKGGSVFVV